MLHVCAEIKESESKRLNPFLLQAGHRRSSGRIILILRASSINLQPGDDSIRETNTPQIDYVTCDHQTALATHTHTHLKLTGKYRQRKG